MHPGQASTSPPPRENPSSAWRRSGLTALPATTLCPRRLLRKASNFQRQPLFVQLWFLPIWVLLGISKALIFTVPFQRLAPWLGQSTGIAPWVPLLGEAQTRRARLIGQAVRMTARYTPWNANCFPQAMTARWLLGLYGLPYVFFFGLARTPDNVAGMQAHAWVVAGSVRVTGGYSFGQYTVVGCFAETTLAASLPR